jgi:hypothetical protein
MLFQTALLLLACSVGISEIIRYDGRKIEPVRPEYLKIPKFAKDDAPNWSPGEGRSYIDLSDLALLATCESKIENGEETSLCGTSNFDILLFKEPSGVDDKYWQDYWEGHQFCCTASAVDSGYCDRSQVNKLIVPNELPEAFSTNFILKPNEVVKFSDDPMMTRHTILESGVYILMMASCDESSPDITLGGQIESMDPYGYVFCYTTVLPPILDTCFCLSLSYPSIASYLHSLTPPCTSLTIISHSINHQSTPHTHILVTF